MNEIFLVSDVVAERIDSFVAKNTELELTMSVSLGFGGHNACGGFTKI